MVALILRAESNENWSVFMAGASLCIVLYMCVGRDVNV